MNLRIVRSPLRTSLALCALTILAVMAFPGKVAAQASPCPGTVSGSYLVGDIVATSASPNPCISVGADNTTITFTSGSVIDITMLTNSGVAIDTNGHTGVVITGPNSSYIGPANIVTAYANSAASAGIQSEGAADVTISGLTFWNITNVSGACSPGNDSSTTQPNYNYGTAIALTNATGATISGNEIECYQFGISVSASNIPSKGTGEIGGNHITAATYYNPTGPTTVDSGGIILDSSSGWTVDSNQINYSGSLDSSAACTAFTNDAANGCSAGLQLTGNSNHNNVTSNVVTMNFGPGIYTASGTSHNNILNNSTQANPLADLWDDVPPHSSNAWRKNTCLNSLGSVSPQKCP